jgi:hypothetical protein
MNNHRFRFSMCFVKHLPLLLSMQHHAFTPFPDGGQSLKKKHASKTRMDERSI